MNKILYLECYSGISGDMTVSALLDLGADQRVLIDGLNSLKVEGYEIKIGRTKKTGIDACSFDVILEHQHHHHDHHHHHHHRNILDIYKIIEDSDISERARDISKKIFDVVAKAEAKAHGVELEKVHFHEVGAIDSIVDIVATAICIDNLGIEEVIVSELYEGKGHVKCQHGIIPVPVPAVVNIGIEHSLKLKIVDVEGEMVTPTGAAIAAALKTKDNLPSNYTIKDIGIGSGKKDFPRANILRAFIIEPNKKTRNLEEVGPWVLETNIDDTTGESLGFTMEKLLEKGALDVFFTPIYMKKNRPAYQLTIICYQEDIKELQRVIFKNTSTIGIRKYQVERAILDRRRETIETKFGPIRYKISSFEGEEYYYPEYEDIKKICEKTGLGFEKVYRQIQI
ncbi:MAG TPA: nickel pincer cofactor biosynthesis protein LarC [Eubacteriaceae bacterium]|nr:nickel pincer cofactor biosynthesis protein LarC [Eubacteriaceae bacterium]